MFSFILKARFHYERGKEHSLFVVRCILCLLIFFALASILTACFNRRSIKETKNALFQLVVETGLKHKVIEVADPWPS